MIERQELHCHNCMMYVQFDLDTELNGNHVLTCPVCGHQHFREVIDGKITESRWGSANQPSPSMQPFVVSNVSWSSNSTWYSANSTATASVTPGYSGNMFLYNSWMNSTSTA